MLSSLNACVFPVFPSRPRCLSSTSSLAACAGSYHAHARAARAQASWRRWRRCWAASWTTSASAAWSRPAALDLVAALCARRGWATVRIDGGTEPGRRQEVVDGFNLYNRGQARADC